MGWPSPIYHLAILLAFGLRLTVWTHLRFTRLSMAAQRLTSPSLGYLRHLPLGFLEDCAN